MPQSRMTQGTSNSDKPLLSICVPTYNRSKFLRVMLQALLPQAKECGDHVEVWILDNASPDDTQAVIEQSRSLGPFHAWKNESNLGPLLNIVKGPRDLARGEYVWVLGDHNLMIPGALSRILQMLRQHESLDIFYTNFRCATYPLQWPSDALGGYDGAFAYPGNYRAETGVVSQWKELLDPGSAFGTQNYVHIVRTKIWKDYWRSFSSNERYVDVKTTYPHTKMIVDTLFDAPAYYSAAPALTVFNGAQSWGDPNTRLHVYLNGLAGLINEFKERGVDAKTIRFWKNISCLPVTTEALATAIASLGFFSVFWRVSHSTPFESYVWRAFWRGFLKSHSNVVSRRFAAVDRWIRNHRSWWLFNCRPARWIRRLF
jgi:glycosyltransferase involved in cell wall biosynthesis